MKTADFLVELGTEELPPVALKALSTAFTTEICANLKNAKLSFDEKSVRSFATPRRLAVYIEKLQTQQEDEVIEKLGPNVAAAYDKEGNPSKAAEGFARSNGIAFSELTTVETDKGERLCFRSTQKGQATASLLGDIIQQALDKLPIPKRMRWGASRTEFVRPAHWLVVLLDENIVPCTLLGLTASNQSFGHRFHAPKALSITSPGNYEQLLETKGQVIPSFEKRRALIQQQVEDIASQLNGQGVIEEDLLDEVTALVEKPVCLSGQFDESFLDVPQEALIYSMSEHQKYFHILDNNGTLLPHFITVSNIQSSDPDKVISGNERVIRPRLADAAFFFETDKKASLQTMRDRLQSIVFQKDLGTVFEKTERITTLAQSIAGIIGADTDAAKTAGQLCKADLASDMVLEFDKMQGSAGYYYAVNDGLPEPIAIAIKQHYWPKFAGDSVPDALLSNAVALADRFDTLTGIFSIGQEPSGSKDPFALRRAAIGILQIILQNNLTLDLTDIVSRAVSLHKTSGDDEKNKATTHRVIDYIFDRFAALYREQDISTPIFQAVRSKAITDALDFDARVKAVAAFSTTAESDSLASANKRVSNILAKSSETSSALDESLLIEAAEKSLYALLSEKEAVVKPLFANGRYNDGLLALTDLKEPIDAFFDSVMVNADDAALKNNRLALLEQLRNIFFDVADISFLAPAKK